MTAAALMSSISSLASGISGAFQDNKPDKDYRDAIRRQQEYSEASINPNHSWTRALADTITQQLKEEAAGALSEESRQRRRLLAAGRTPVGIASSRVDESRTGALARSFIDAARMGLTGSMQQLGRAAGVQGSIAENFGDYNEVSSLGKQTQRQNMTQLGQSGPFAAANIFQIIKNMFKEEETPQTTSYGGTVGGGSTGGTIGGMNLYA